MENKVKEIFNIIEKQQTDFITILKERITLRNEIYTFFNLSDSSDYKNLYKELIEKGDTFKLVGYDNGYYSVINLINNVTYSINNLNFSDDHLMNNTITNVKEYKIEKLKEKRDELQNCCDGSLYREFNTLIDLYENKFYTNEEIFHIVKENSLKILNQNEDK
jgi:hypothetical protein